MTVYIVMYGERCEGGSISGVYSSRDAAMKHARECVDPIGRPFELTKDDGDSAYFEAGCDFVSVESHTVDRFVK